MEPSSGHTDFASASESSLQVLTQSLCISHSSPSVGRFGYGNPCAPIELLSCKHGGGRTPLGHYSHNLFGSCAVSCHSSLPKALQCLARSETARDDLGNDSDNVCVRARAWYSVAVHALLHRPAYAVHL
eukprot:4535240-Amphidinium_carterae.2